MLVNHEQEFSWANGKSFQLRVLGIAGNGGGNGVTRGDYRSQEGSVI
jgi:hypothetical protein